MPDSIRDRGHFTGFFPQYTTEQVEKARLAVADRSLDVEDAKMLLAMLGLDEQK